MNRNPSGSSDPSGRASSPSVSTCLSSHARLATTSAVVDASRGRRGSYPRRTGRLTPPAGDTYGASRGRGGRGGARATVRAADRAVRRPPDVRLLPEDPGAPVVAAAPVGPARARRAVVHRRPPGVRAVVQATAVRAGVGPRPDVRRRCGARAPLPGARARDRARVDRAHPGPAVDVAAGLPGVPRVADAGVGVPVGAVPRARVHLRAEGGALPPGHGRGGRGARSPPTTAGRAHVVGRVLRAPARRAATRCRTTMPASA